MQNIAEEERCAWLAQPLFFIHDNRFAGEACNLLFMTIASLHSVLSIVL